MESPPPIDLGGSVRARWTDRLSGDLRPATDVGVAVDFDSDPIVGSLRRLRGQPDAIVWLTQVHGSVVRVVSPERSRSTLGAPGDALVASAPGVTLTILTADCASIALGSDEGVFAAVHAGWRGLMSGVLSSAIASMRTEGATQITAALGPCIHPECYEFSPSDLAEVANRFGDVVRGTTSGGSLALDLPAAVGVALEECDVRGVSGIDACTACSGRYFSHRARADRERQALLVWSDRPDY